MEEKKKKPKLVIWDGDGGLFRASWNYRDLQNMMGIMASKKKLDQEIELIIEKTQPDFFLMFHGKPGSKCFRYDVATIKPYKDSRINRSDTWSEYFKKPLKDHLRDKWGSYEMEMIEADDACSIALNKYKDDYECILVYEDHDFYQLADMVHQPVKGYNPNKKKYMYLSEEVSKYEWWKQMLTGCKGDSVPGLEGIGGHYGEIGERGHIIRSTQDTLKCKSDMILAMRKDDSDEAYFEVVRDAYINKYKTHYLPFLTENYILLRMLSKPLFDFPKEIALQPVIKKAEDVKHTQTLEGL